MRIGRRFLPLTAHCGAGAHRDAAHQHDHGREGQLGDRAGITERAIEHRNAAGRRDVEVDLGGQSPVDLQSCVDPVGRPC